MNTEKEPNPQAAPPAAESPGPGPVMETQAAKDPQEPPHETQDEAPDEAQDEAAFGCPECGSGQLYRSRYRSWFERMRRNLSARRPYRCWSCEWRGWLVPAPQDAQAPAVLWAGEVAPLNLDAIDAAVAMPDPPREEGPTARR